MSADVEEEIIEVEESAPEQAAAEAEEPAAEVEDPAATDAEVEEESTADPEPAEHPEDPEDGELGDATAVERGVLEALLFASDVPLSLAKMRSVLGRGTKTADLRAGLEEIRQDLDERRAGFIVLRVAGGYQIRTRPDYAEVVRKLKSERPSRLSRPAMETLVVVAYRQPVTRAEIEDIRRVDTGAVLRTLLDRELIRVVGRKDVPGRPVIYGTTRDFLEVFGFESLRELPTLKEIKDVAEEMGAGIDLPDDILDPSTAAPEGEEGDAPQGDAPQAEASEMEDPLDDVAEGEPDGGSETDGEAESLDEVEGLDEQNVADEQAEDRGPIESEAGESDEHAGGAADVDEENG